jgi:hypothetical protein
VWGILRKWYSCALATLGLVCDCRNFEKHWYCLYVVPVWKNLQTNHNTNMRLFCYVMIVLQYQIDVEGPVWRVVMEIYFCVCGLEFVWDTYVYASVRLTLLYCGISARQNRIVLPPFIFRMYECVITTNQLNQSVGPWESIHIHGCRHSYHECQVIVPHKAFV